MCIGVRRGRPVVEYTTTYAIGEYRHHNCEFKSLFQRSVLDEHYLIMFNSYSYCQWFSPVSHTNKTDRHDIVKYC